MKISGKRAAKVFQNEYGGIRWQRVPPNEKRGRVHTSTITVAILPVPQGHEITINAKDLKETFTCGSGAGGQHRNKNATAVQLTHVPTGITVRAESERSQKQNRENALMLLKAKLLSEKRTKEQKARSDMRKKQVGSGQRADKVRTVQVRHDKVIDHRNNKSITYKEYIKGKLDGLY